MNPLVKDRLTKQRTIFYPGSRIKMNIVPMFGSLFVPWAVFTFLCGLCSSSLMYGQPGIVFATVGGVAAVWAFTLFKAVQARRHDPEPTWLSYIALMVGVAAVAGVFCGLMNYRVLMRPYYAIHDLKVVEELDVSRARGQNIMDAGIVYFSGGTSLDPLRSWHFKSGKLYCVSPITVNGQTPETQSYDFWAVGEGCCAEAASDFRCGAWGAQAHGALRVVNDDAIPFYRLAVKQAETLYGIMATQPVFFSWSKNPKQEMLAWTAMATKNYLLMISVAFVFSMFCLTLATCQFAWLGRGGNANIYTDDNWISAAPPAGPFEPARQVYGTA